MTEYNGGSPEPRGKKHRAMARGLAKSSGGIAAALLALELAAAPSASAHAKSAASPALTTVKLAVLPSHVTDSYVPLYAAQNLGIAKANGLKLDLVPVESGAAIVTSVVAGVAHYGVSAPLAAVAEAVQNGAKLETIGLSAPENVGFFLEAKAGSGITKVSQLAGKSICVTSTGSETYDDASYTNATHHLGATIVPVGSSALESTLMAGQATACVITAPVADELLAHHQAIDLVNYSHALPFWGAWFGASGYAESHKQLTTRLLNMWFETLARLKKHPKLGIKEFEKISKESPLVAKAEYKWIKESPTNSALSLKDVKETYKMLHAAGVKSLPPESQLATKKWAKANG